MNRTFAPGKGCRNWRIDIHEKEALMVAEPDKYFQIPHYEAHPAVLVRLEAISLEEL